MTVPCRARSGQVLAAGLRDNFFRIHCVNFSIPTFVPYIITGTTFTGSRPVISANSALVSHCIINRLKKKRRMLYLNAQVVPRSKHFSSWL